MKTVTIRKVVFGEGIPKICIPITGKTKEEILVQAKKAAGSEGNFVEWRCDCYENWNDGDAVLDVLQQLENQIFPMPLLFTFRTTAEGGRRPATEEEYRDLLMLAADSGLIDLVDLEVFSQETYAQSLIEHFRKAKVTVIGSNHAFHATPDSEEISRRLRYMQQMGVDITKIAVMPENLEDVLVLLHATAQMAKKYADRPFITMSMGKTGCISRFCGEIFGSAVTFGTQGAASAPGQIPAEQLKAMMEMIHQMISE